MSAHCASALPVLRLANCYSRADLGVLPIRSVDGGTPGTLTLHPDLVITHTNLLAHPERARVSQTLPSWVVNEHPLGLASHSNWWIWAWTEVKSTLGVCNGKDDPLLESRSESFPTPFDLQAFSCISAFHISSKVSEIWKSCIMCKEWPCSLLSFYLFNKYGI